VVDIEYEVDLNLEYEKRLEKFKKYRKQGVDLAYRCDRCGKLIVQSDILSGIGCRKCGALKVYPITASLTWFGVCWCRFWSWYHDEKIRSNKSNIAF